MTVEETMQFSYMRGYRDGLARAEQLVQGNIDSKVHACEGQAKGEPKPRPAKRLCARVGFARPRHQH